MLEFEVLQAEDGEYAAACNDERIYAEGATLQELYDNMLAAVKERYGEDSAPSPEDIKLVLYSEKTVNPSPVS